MNPTKRALSSLVLIALLLAACPVVAAERSLQPVVEIEENVYSYEPANNGSGPMWCSGSTCLVRIADDVFASGIETLTQVQPLNNCRWTLFKRVTDGWQLQQTDFRRLFYTWTDDITGGRFHDWVEVASRDKTGGWVSPCDLWVAPDGAVHLLWRERAIDTRLREQFFPEAKQSQALNYAIIRDGQVISRRTLVLAEEGGANEIANAARFQVTPENRLFVFYYVNGTDPKGKRVSENRLLELRNDGTETEAVTIPMEHPLTAYFTATVRGGSPPSNILELLGTRADAANTISYARIRLWYGNP